MAHGGDEGIAEDVVCATHGLRHAGEGLDVRAEIYEGTRQIKGLDVELGALLTL